MISPIIQGLQSGISATNAKRHVAFHQLQRNTSEVAVSQFFQGLGTVGLVDYSLAVAKLRPIPSIAKPLIHLTPFLLNELQTAKFVPEKIKPLITFCHDHLGTLYQVATVVSSLSLLYFGQVYFALPSLLILGIGYMDQMGWLPSSFQYVWDKYSEPFCIFSSLFVGSFSSRVSAILPMLLRELETHLSSQKRMQRPDFTVQQNLSFERARAFLKAQIPLKVNPDYIHRSRVTTIPEIDIENLLEKFEEINWEIQMPILRGKLEHSPLFLEKHIHPIICSDRKIKEFTKNQLQKFILDAKKDSSLALDKTLHNYLKRIAKYVQDLPHKAGRAYILFRLAIEPEECRAGRFTIAEEIYAQACKTAKEVSFEDKVFYCLQDERNRWMKDFYSNSYGKNPFTLFFSPFRQYNSYLNCHGEHFGLGKAAVYQDSLGAELPPLGKWFESYAWKDDLQEEFWAAHGCREHATILEQAISHSLLSPSDVVAFWQNWIERQPSGPDKEFALREFEENKIFGQPIIQIGGQINRDLIYLILFDMGILTERIPGVIQESGAAKKAPWF